MLRLCVLVGSAFISASILAADYPYRGCFEITSQRHHIDLDLLLAIASVESNWDADARSNANAHGIMQIRWPLTARHLGAGRIAELYNPCLNINLGAQYLHELSNKYAGDNRLMLAAYNYGPTRIRKAADIPLKVQGYIDKVNKRRRRIAADMNAAAPVALNTDTTLEVIRFDNVLRAQQYLAALKKRAPRAELHITQNPAGPHIVYLNPGNLDAATRHILATLLPQLSQRE